MWQKPIRWSRRITRCLIALVIGTAAYFGFVEPWVCGLTLRHSILREIAGAKEIRVIEHSIKWDDIHAGKFPIKPNWKETVYATVTLTSNQASQLRTIFSPARDYSDFIDPACIFEPHHRIQMLRPDGSVYSIEICFLCGQLAINGENERMFPVGWESRLDGFISSISLRPNGPWEENGNR